MAAFEDPKSKLINAAVAHVAFDGWGAETLRQAAQDCDIPLAEVEALFPRGAVDLALAYHRSGDVAMIAAIKAAADTDMRYSERVAHAVRQRLSVADKEAVRRGTTLFAMPQHTADGAGAIWETADAIWTALGDTSDDVNWYTKRMTLSAVYSSVVLFWLGDTSDGDQDTWAFLERRIDNVMQFERTKAQLRQNPLFKSFMAGPGKVLEHIKAPTGSHAQGFPGHWDKNS